MAVRLQDKATAARRSTTGAILCVAAILSFFVGSFMLWRAYILDDTPDASRLKSIAGIPSSWGTQKVVGDVICMRELRHCLRMAKPWIERERVEDGLRSGLPVTVRYDPASISAWGSRIYYSTFELEIDQQMIFSYEVMRENLASSRRFSVGAVAVLYFFCIALAIAAYRRSGLAISS